MLARIERVRIFEVVNEEFVGILITSVINLALDGLVALAFETIVPAAVLELPNRDVLDVVALRNDGTAGLEDQRVETLFGKFLRGPTTGDA